MNVKWIIGFIFLISLISTLIMPEYSKPIALTKEQKVEIYIESIGKAIAMIKDDTGTFPSSTSGVEAINTNVNDDNNWKGPYTGKVVSPRAKDPWNNEFIYKYPHQCTARVGSFALYSAGENGIDECMSGDDIYEELE